MSQHVSRRTFLNTAGVAAAGGIIPHSAAAGSDRSDAAEKVLIAGVSCSPRKGKTTSTAVKTALKAAKGVDPRIEVKLIDLGGKDISGWAGGAAPGATQEIRDDFQSVALPTLTASNLGGLIIGSPVYFRTMSSLCKAFLERLAVLRKPRLLLADIPVGVVAVGAYRNGGQELVIEHILTAMLCHEVMAVGGKPPAHQGATLWNASDDDITKDEFGIQSARKVGIRVAEAALKLTK
ncbi:MAG: flavodoxin family protein [Planctomycetota bacterium]|jgi:multimeric flavodoxin WrbA